MSPPLVVPERFEPFFSTARPQGYSLPWGYISCARVRRRMIMPGIKDFLQENLGCFSSTLDVLNMIFTYVYLSQTESPRRRIKKKQTFLRLGNRRKPRWKNRGLTWIPPWTEMSFVNIGSCSSHLGTCFTNHPDNTNKVCYYQFGRLEMYWVYGPPWANPIAAAKGPKSTD